MQVRQQILSATLIFLAVSCNFNSNKKQSKTFYNTISGWDIIHVPIIEPYRATSLDKGRTWTINQSEVNSVDVSGFGVSQNFIYGHGRIKWFLFDRKSKLYAEYKTKEELINSLKSFHAPINAIADCNTYFDSLAKGHALYWYPKDGKTYPSYPEITPDAVTTINISENARQLPDISFNESPKFKKNKVYFFKVNYKKKDNDLYYLSFDNSPPIRVKDSLLIPVFNDNNQIEITLYTPYPVAQEKGIPEEKRFHKSKTIYIR